uniref:Origin recognition complex subunit 2 n=1 Tax=Anopheles epiroticus TaxID=199890 RepID=A0A182P190_9DIPT
MSSINTAKLPLTSSDEDDRSIVIESDGTDPPMEEEPAKPSTPVSVRRSSRIVSPSTRYAKDYVVPTRTRRGGGQAEVSESGTSASESGDSEEEELELLNNKVAATTLFEAQTDVDGAGMYGFRTPKKRGSMSALAQAASSVQRTPRSTNGGSAVAPRTPRTPRTTAGTSGAAMVPKTPMHERQRAKKELSKALQASIMSDFSASESDYAPSGDSESDTDEGREEESELDDQSSDGYSCSADNESEHSSAPSTAANRRQARASNGRTPSKPNLAIPVPASLPGRATRATATKKNAPELQYIVQSDDYFSTFTGGKSVTSDHTLDRLKTPRLPQDVLLRLLEETNAAGTHAAAIQELLDEHGHHFARWLFLLDQGYSVLLYGLGSKRSLLQAFHHQMLADRPVLVVNGFFPSLAVKDVLDALANDLLDLQLQTGLHHETIDEIERELAHQPDLHVFLLVHNLDGVAMRHERMQTTLSRLAALPNVHLVATIDHINAPLLWDGSKLSQYNFAWWDTTTLLPYSVETAFENSLLVQNAGALALSSMGSVYASLTSNARGIFMAIVRHQLEHGVPGNAHYQGMPLKELYWACREAFLVSSDIALRAQLTEFTDHKLLRIKRTLDGSENLHIPIEHGLLKRFVDETAKKV